MPKKISSLVGAMKLHLLVFESDGKIKKKNLPTDPYFKAVQIKVPRPTVRRPRQEENLNEGFHEGFIDEPGPEESDQNSSDFSEDDN